MEIQQFQQLDYCLRPIAPLQQYLLHPEVLTEDEVYEKSLLAEPRGNTS